MLNSISKETEKIAAQIAAISVYKQLGSNLLEKNYESVFVT